MMIGFCIDLAVGLLCVILGLLIGKKQKVSLLHDYHYRNVRTEDIPAYARRMGIGLDLIGAGICLMGCANLANKMAIGWIAFAVCAVSGFVVMHKAQKKYNGSWFS